MDYLDNHIDIYPFPVKVDHYDMAYFSSYVGILMVELVDNGPEDIYIQVIVTDMEYIVLYLDNPVLRVFVDKTNDDNEYYLTHLWVVLDIQFQNILVLDHLIMIDVVGKNEKIVVHNVSLHQEY